MDRDNEWKYALSRLEAMQFHPEDFSAYEIIAQLNADTMDKMTAGMAAIIQARYSKQDAIKESQTSLLYYPIQWAWSEFQPVKR